MQRDNANVIVGEKLLDAFRRDHIVNLDRREAEAGRSFGEGEHVVHLIAIEPKAAATTATTRLRRNPRKLSRPMRGTATPAAQAAASATGRAANAPRPRAITAAMAQGTKPTQHQTAKKKRTKAVRASVVMA